MRIIEVANISVEVEWKNIKNVHLTIYPPNARVHVSAPIGMTDEAVRLFLVTKIPWINQRISQILNQSRQTPREYVSGENHYFKGHRYRLKVLYHNAPAKVEIQGNEYIKLYVREGATEERRAEVLREWYRSELKLILHTLIAQWEKTLKVTVNKWEVKQMKTLWGSCNHHTRNIIFNLELIKKPLSCIEYIVVHELLHIRVRLHNEEYTALLNRYFPNWRILKDELNEFIV
ncbi:SprT family zinc-dependent metalloprotease [uncultured Phocaeicola sp.]|uniref:M48 family metallopeptidase n=1 Tax=uncultured Phocaeicola sp. TaxID=990718 RepID=UPI0025963D99|nr:SprT family zinc-dependent metalloprotease [uncultured Phocaeicola sp.]